MDPDESIHVPTELGSGRTGIVAGRVLIEFGKVPEAAGFLSEGGSCTVRDGGESATRGLPP